MTYHIRGDFGTTTQALQGNANEFDMSHAGGLIPNVVTYLVVNDAWNDTPPNCLLHDSNAGTGASNLTGSDGAGTKLNIALAAGICFRARLRLMSEPTGQATVQICKNSDNAVLCQFHYYGDSAGAGYEQQPEGTLAPFSADNLATSIGYLDHMAKKPAAHLRNSGGFLDVCFYVREQSGSNWIVECWIQNDRMNGANPWGRDWFPVMRGTIPANSVYPKLVLKGFAAQDVIAVDYIEFSLNEFDPATLSRWRYIANTDNPAPNTGDGMNTGAVTYVPSSGTVVALCQDGTTENDADWHVDAYTGPSPFTSWTKVVPDSTPLFQADTTLTANGDAGGGAQTPEEAGWIVGDTVKDNNGGAEWTGLIVAITGNAVRVQMLDGYTSDSVTVASGINNTTRTDTATLASKADLHNCGNPGLLWIDGTTVLAWCNRGFYSATDRWMVGRISTDSGATWGAEFDIVPTSANKDYLATGTGCVLRNGRICVPVHEYETGKTNHIAYSDDRGATWTLSAASGIISHNEPTCCQMPNGQLLMACRDNTGEYMETVICAAPETDLDTWGTPVEHDGQSGRQLVPNGVAPISAVSDKDKVYLFTNGAYVNREVINIFESDDNGATWTISKKSPLAVNGMRAPIYIHACRWNRELFLVGFTLWTGVLYHDDEWFPDQKMVETEHAIQYAP